MLFGKLSPRRFRDAFVDELRKAQPDAQVRLLSDEEVEVSSAGWDVALIRVFLGNAYRDYRKAPNSKAEIHRRFVESVRAAGAPPEPAADRVARFVSIVRNRAWLQAMLSATAPQGETEPPIIRPIAGDLIEVAAEAKGPGFMYAGRSAMLALAGDEAAVWAACRAHIDERVGEAQVGHLDDGVYLVSAPSGIASSLLLSDSFWAAQSVKDPVVGVFGKDHFLFASAADEQALSRLRNIALAQAGAPDTLSVELIARGSGGWVIAPTA